MSTPKSNTDVTKLALKCSFTIHANVSDHSRIQGTFVVWTKKEHKSRVKFKIICTKPVPLNCFSMEIRNNSGDYVCTISKKSDDDEDSCVYTYNVGQPHDATGATLLGKFLLPHALLLCQMFAVHADTYKNFSDTMVFWDVVYEYGTLEGLADFAAFAAL